jgi:hypothetical protein
MSVTWNATGPAAEELVVKIVAQFVKSIVAWREYITPAWPSKPIDSAGALPPFVLDIEHRGGGRRRRLLLQPVKAPGITRHV